MRKILIAVLTVLLVISLCACSLNKKTEDTDKSSVVNSDVSGVEQTQSQETSKENNKRDELMTFQVEINGKSLTVPFEYSELTSLGYSLEEDDDLKANTYTIGTYVKNADGESLHLQFWNPSTETKKYSQCQISEIEITLDKKLDVTLPGGIKFDENLTPEQVLELYGEADMDLDEDDYRSLSYEDGGYKQVKFMFYKEDKMKGYNELTINHIND